MTVANNNFIEGSPLTVNSCVSQMGLRRLMWARVQYTECGLAAEGGLAHDAEGAD